MIYGIRSIRILVKRKSNSDKVLVTHDCNRCRYAVTCLCMWLYWLSFFCQDEVFLKQNQWHTLLDPDMEKRVSNLSENLKNWTIA